MTSDSNSSGPQPQPLALPAPGETPDPTKRLDVSTGESDTIKFDELGPVVVNSDGTLSRISNWANLTELERERTVRVLVKRNKIRLQNQEKDVDADGTSEKVSALGE